MSLNRCGLNDIRLKLKVPNLLGKTTEIDVTISCLYSTESRPLNLRTLYKDISLELSGSDLTFQKMLAVLRLIKKKTKAKNLYLSCWFSCPQHPGSVYFLYELIMSDNQVKSFIKVNVDFMPIDICVECEGNFESMIHHDELLNLLKSATKGGTKTTIFNIADNLDALFKDFNRIIDYCFILVQSPKNDTGLPCKDRLRIERWKGLVGGLRPNLSYLREF